MKLAQISKPTLLKLLLEDFERMFPDANRETRAELYTRLTCLERAGLELLVSQLPADVLKQLPGGGE